MVTKKTTGDKVFTFCNTLFLCLFTALILYPFIYIVSVSISDPVLVMKGKVLFLPKSLNLESYSYIIKYRNFWQAYGNTVWYTTVGTAWGLILTMLTAYPLSRKNLKGKGFYMKVVIFQFILKISCQ